MTADRELFGRAVTAALAGKRSIRHGGILYNARYFAAMNIGNHEPLPRNIRIALGLKAGANYHQGTCRLLRLLLNKN